MSDIPEHIWEAARSLRNAVCWQSNASVEPIAAALLTAEQRGREMEREEQDRRTEEYPKRWAERYCTAIRSRSEGKSE